MLLKPYPEINSEISLHAARSSRRKNAHLYALLFAGAFTLSCRTASKADARFEFTQPQMGVPFRIVLYAPSKSKAEAVASATFHRISELNNILSDYDTDSELNRLCRTAGQSLEVPVSPDLWNVLAQSQQLARESEGAFDITVRPVVSLWRNARREKKFPDAKRLGEARALVGWTNLVLNPVNRTAKLLISDMRLDLGGIAKGYAVDEAMKVLRARGIRRALVSGGGDLVVSAAPAGQKGWRIEVAPLDVPNAPPKKFVLLSHAGLATSGDAFQHVELEGTRYSHIIDPRTGIGLTDHSLVTIVAPDCTTADALATAVSVLGPTKGFKLVERQPSA